MKLTRFSVFLVGMTMIGLLVSLMSNVPESGAAFGTSPPWVRNDHILPGTTYETIVNLSRSDTEEEVKVNVRVDGDKEIRKWLEVENQKDLIFRIGQNILPMKVIIEVPKRAAIKDYRGGIFVTLQKVQPEELKGGTVGIALGGHISVNISVVGVKITDYRVKSVSLIDLTTEEPFYFDIEIENLGNTEITEINGQIDIYDKQETEILKSLTFGDLLDAIAPDELIKTKIVFDNIYLEPGEYWVKVKVFKGNEVIFENRLFQEVSEKVVPVVTPEDVDARKPSLPQISEEETVLEPEAYEELRAVAQPQPESKLFLIFGLIGFSFGILALVAVIVILVVLLKRQHQATIQQYLAQSQHKEDQSNTP